MSVPAARIEADLPCPRWLVGYSFVAIFLISLQSFYFASGGAWLCYAGALLLLPLAAGRRIAVEPLLIAAALLCMTTFQMLSAAGFEPKSALGALFSVLMLSVISSAYRDRKSALLTAVSLCLLAHLGAFLVQVLWWAGTGIVMDMSGLLGFEPASWSSTAKSLTVAGVIVPRFTGLLNEPGTYSAVVIALTIAHYALRRALTPISLAALASVAATASLGGGVLILALLCAIAADLMLRRGRLGLGQATIVAALGAGALILLARLFEKRQALGPAETVFHSGMVRWITAHENLSLNGMPYGALPAGFIVNDIGVWADVLVRWGVLGLAALAIYLAVVVGGVQALLMAPLLLTKLKLTYPLLFVVVATVRLGPVGRSA